MLGKFHREDAYTEFVPCDSVMKQCPVLSSDGSKWLTEGCDLQVGHALTTGLLVLSSLPFSPRSEHPPPF